MKIVFGMTIFFLSTLAIANGEDAPSPVAIDTDYSGKMIFSGGESAVWLVRPDRDTGTFDAVVRPAGGDWKWSCQEIQGRPQSAAVVGGRLHLLLEGAGYLILSADVPSPSLGASPGGSGWPASAEVKAMCEAQDVSGMEDASVIAVISRLGKSPTSSTSKSKPTSQQNSSLAVFVCAGGKWKLMADLDCDLAGQGSSVFAAAVGRTLHLLLRSADGKNIILQSWNGGKWTQKDLRGVLSDGEKPIGIVNLNGQIAIVSTVAKQASDEKKTLTTFIRTMDEKGSFIAKPVVHADKKQVHWPASLQPNVARLGKQLAFLWGEDEDIQFAICSRSGQLQTAQDVAIFHEGNKVWEQYVVRYFMIGLLISIILSMIILPPKPQSRPFLPFILPKGCVPGNIGKRLAAGLIDLLPFSFISAIAFPIDHAAAMKTFKQVISGTDQVNIPDNVVIASVAMLAMYCMYCIIMESTFAGATIGKKLFHLRVVGNENTPLNAREAVLRNLLKVLELLYFMLLVIPLFSRYRQRLADMIAKTIVIDANVTPPKEDDPLDIGSLPRKFPPTQDEDEKGRD